MVVMVVVMVMVMLLWMMMIPQVRSGLLCQKE